MCTTCGCENGQTLIGGHALRQHRKPDGSLRFRMHGADAQVAEVSTSRIVKLEQDLLAKNNNYADANRRYLSERGIFALNLVSSPGSGKTTLLVQTIAALNGAQPLAVIEGDQQTENDAAHKVVILSVTEGEDKPLKYPDMFRAASLMLLNKCDLLPHLEFDADLAIEYAHRINPKLQVIRISATSGAGMAEWLEWVKDGCRNAVAAKPEASFG